MPPQNDTGLPAHSENEAHSAGPGPRKQLVGKREAPNVKAVKLK